MAEQFRQGDRENRDLVLPPGTYAYLQDRGSGAVRTVVGPSSVPISAQDLPVRFNQATGSFEQCTPEQVIIQNIKADEGSYIVLNNPVQIAQGSGLAHPEQGQQKSVPNLQLGRKIVIPGPAQFSLWPGQTATVIGGHHLRSNQYLLVCVYNVDEAKKNWNTAVVATQDTATDDKKKSKAFQAADLTQGKLLVIKGTDVSFYIPPTGVEVVPEGNEYIREAVSLEQLEYCILVDENGKKRYERGPKVVFPAPTEAFLKDEKGNIKFMAFELNATSGIHVKVITAHEKHKEGEELFITGNDNAIYFPQPEHSMIKYGSKQVHHATAIQKGQGRYVMNRTTGEIRTERGYKMLLPDPRTEVMVRRVLSDSEADLWYPGNAGVREYNRSLRAIKSTVQNVVSEREYEANYMSDVFGAVAAAALPSPTRALRSAAPARAADEFERGTSYTEPRTITFNNKHDGVPVIQVWTGYAVMVVSADGSRRVVVGPNRLLLNYDETLEVLELSTGKPKSTDTLLKTVYLRVLNNKVSDIFAVETSDHVKVDLRVSFVVDFEGKSAQDRNAWFDVSNYVKFLCDHIRSVLKGVVKKQTIDQFYSDYVSIIRDAVLGKVDGTKGRSGMLFSENNMRVKDVEILSAEISDPAIKTMLNAAQHDTVKNNIELAQTRRIVEATKSREALARERMLAEADTIKAKHDLAQIALRQKAEIALLELANELAKIAETKKTEIAAQEVRDLVNTSNLARERAAMQQSQEFKTKEVELEKTRMAAEVDAAVKRFEAAGKQFGDVALALNNNETLRVMAESLNTLRFIGGDSVVDAVQKVFQGTPLAEIVAGLAVNGVARTTRIGSTISDAQAIR